jgi:hypothetical protein
MTALEEALVDLGRHLDHGDGDELPAAVLSRITTPDRGAVPPWVKVAAALLLALAIAVAVPSSRRALARWFGIGAIEVRGVTTTLPVGAPDRTVPGSVPSSVANSTTSTTSDALAAARNDLAFTPLVAGSAAGPIIAVETDPRVPGGLVAITYGRFTLVELASKPDAFPIMSKQVPPGATVTFSDVDGVQALWIEGAHEISYLAPDGSVRKDTVRMSGNVLLWTVGSVTTRIEGLPTLAEALQVASTVH